MNKKKGKTSRINPRQARSRSASSPVSQRCRLSHFMGKACRFPRSRGRRSGGPGAALPADLVGIIPRPDGSRRAFPHLIWLLLLVRSEDFLQTVGRAPGMLGCL